MKRNCSPPIEFSIGSVLDLFIGTIGFIVANTPLGPSGLWPTICDIVCSLLPPPSRLLPHSSKQQCLLRILRAVKKHWKDGQSLVTRSHHIMLAMFSSSGSVFFEGASSASKRKTTILGDPLKKSPAHIKVGGRRSPHGTRNVRMNT